MYTVVITVFNFVVSIQLYVKALTEMAMDIQGRLDGTCQHTHSHISFDSHDSSRNGTSQTNPNPNETEKKRRESISLVLYNLN